MRSNLYYPPCNCKQPPKSNKLWLHSLKDSKLVEVGSKEYNVLLLNGYIVNKADLKEDTFDISSLSYDELVELGKRVGLNRAKRMKRETLIKRMEEIRDE